MRVCDITREDEVVAVVKIDIAPLGENGLPGLEETRYIEVGKRALDAIQAGAWGALQALIPPALRVKDAKKAAAGKKAAATRQANKGQKAATPTTEAPAAPVVGSGTNATPAASESSTGAPEGAGEGEGEYDSGDPGF